MLIPNIIIAVDGFSSTGKSTLAKLIAAKYDFLYLDSGALYRGVTLLAQEQSFITEDDRLDLPGLQAGLDADFDLHFEKDGAYIGERNIEKEIRSLKVSSQVSIIAAIPFVRAFVDRRLRAFGEKGRVVMDGRDIGSAVFPDAELKIFITSKAEIRAQRRFDEMKAKGMEADLQAIIDNLKERDYIDSHRETNPLRQPDDAFVLDNSEMSLDEEMAWVLGLLQGKFGLLE